MASLLIKSLGLAGILATVSSQLIPSTSVTTPLLIKQHGYPIEEHTVQTSDGYILTMHRIPYSPKLNNSANTQRPIAFFMHGIVCSSAVWVLNGPDKSLPYLLSDIGYDIWMGNARGNVYSKKHIILSHLTQAFWNFDLDEISIYDQPAMIDYAVKVTGVEKVCFIGHSQGATTFFIMNALRPSFVKARISSVHLLGPVVYLTNSQSILIRFLAPLAGLPNPTREVTGSIEFLESFLALELLADKLCKDGALFQSECSAIVFLAGGNSSPYLNKTKIPEIASILPAGSSLNQLLHYAQFYNSDQFRQWDYGLLRNPIVYKSRSPPVYNLTNLEVPLYLYYADNDMFDAKTDLDRLIQTLNGTAGFKGAYRVPLNAWNHIDFIFGLGVEKVVYSVVLKDIAKT